MAGVTEQYSTRKLNVSRLVLFWCHGNQHCLISTFYNHMNPQIKSMAQHLHNTGNLKSPRKDLFPSKFHNDLQILIDAIALEVVEKHVKRFAYARTINTSVGFFLMDAFSLMDRGFISFLIRSYIRKVRYSIFNHEVLRN